MNRLQFKIVRELFHELSELPPVDRARLLSERELDPSVLEELESLLDTSESTGAFEDENLGALGSSLVARKLDDYEREEPIPDAIGPYRVLRKLGAGGMGLVYAARRDDTDALAAVKVIRPTVESSSFLRRFRHEVRNLRSLRHVGIAAFHEEGTATIETDTGRATLPYLAMELIEGAPLNQYAADHGLTDGERVELIARVCDALQHAHDRNIVHRDLKPTNILVVGTPGEDAVGQPKLLDFGIARAIDSDGHTMTVTTAGVLMGTLPYMSPEQVGSSRSSIDARSDVYSLGVILYELLTGRLPYPVRGQSIPLATRMILEEEPTRLGSVARRLRGDLEVVASKALEKDPRNRYESAAAFAADLRRHLANEPIRAQSPALFTRAIRFTKRNKALTAVALALFSCLSVALVVTAYFGAQASRRADDYLAMAYRSSMRAAGLAQSVGDLIEVRQHLRDAPVELREWEWNVLDSAMDESVYVRSLDAGERPLSVRFAGSGSEVVTLSRTADNRGGVLRVLDSADGRALSERRLEGDRFGLAPDGERLVRWASDGQVYSERARDGAERMELGQLERGPAGQSRLSSAGPAVLGRESQGVYFEPAEGGSARVTELAGRGFSISPDGLRIAFCHQRKLVAWDPVRGARVGVESNVAGWTALGPESKWICYVPNTGAGLEIWRDDGRGPLTLAWRLAGDLRKTVCVAFSEDGRKLASGGEDQSIRIWDLETGEHRATRVGHTGSILALAFSPDGTRLVSLGEDSTLRTWNTTEEPRVLRHESYVYGARFSPDGARIYTGSWDSFVRAFDTASAAEIARWPTDGRVRSLAVGPDGRWVAAASGTSVVVLDSVDGRELARLDEIDSAGVSIAASPVEDSLLIVDRWAGELFLLDVHSGERIASRRMQAGGARGDVVFSPNGARVAVSRRERGCSLLDARSLDVLREIPVHAARSVAFSPDGRELAIGTATSKIHVVPLDAPGDEVVMEGHTSTVHALRYTSDGRRLVSGSGDHTVGIWDRERRELIARLWGHEDYVFDVDVGPDGERLVTASGDGTARIWEPSPMAKRVAELEDRERRLARLRPLMRERVKRDGIRVTADALQRSPIEPGWDARDRELALQLLLGWGIED